MAVIVNVACAVFAEVAEIVALCSEPTTDVFTGNDPAVWPDGITMLCGTVAEPLFEASVTRMPFSGAGDDNVTVPVEDVPPGTLGGLSDKPLICPEPGGIAVIVRPAWTEFAEVAVMLAFCCEPTIDVFTVKLPVDWPPGITMLPGTVAAELFELRMTSTPASPAGAARVT
jgi:hypothetical protein